MKKFNYLLLFLLITPLLLRGNHRLQHSLDTLDAIGKGAIAKMTLGRGLASALQERGIEKWHGFTNNELSFIAIQGLAPAAYGLAIDNADWKQAVSHVGKIMVVTKVKPAIHDRLKPVLNCLPNSVRENKYLHGIGNLIEEFLLMQLWDSAQKVICGKETILERTGTIKEVKEDDIIIVPKGLFLNLYRVLTSGNKLFSVDPENDETNSSAS